MIYPTLCPSQMQSSASTQVISHANGRISDYSNNKLNSSILSFLLSPSPSPPTLNPNDPAMFIFLSCTRNIRPSIESFTTNLVTVTSRSCPIRCTRSIACASMAKLHHGSIMKTLLAAVRLSPTPPARREINRTVGFGVRLGCGFKLE